MSRPLPDVSPASVARNASVLTAATLAARLSMLALGIVLARSLGADDYGRFSLALAVGVVLQPLADFGVSRYVARETARDRAATERALAVLAAAKLLLLASTYAVTLAVALLAIGDRDLALVLGLMVLAALLDGWSMFAFGYFQGREVMGFEARATAATALARAFGGMALALTTGRLLWVVMWILAVAAVQAAGATWRLRRSVPARATRPMRLERRLVSWRSVAAMGLVSIFVIVYLRVDAVLIGWLVDERAVGLYAAAYTLMLGAQIVPGMLTTALQPVFARTHDGDPAAFVRTWHVGLRALLLFTLPVAVTISVLAGPVIDRCFGEEFAASAEVLRVIIWICPLVAWSLAAQAVLRGARRETTLMRVAGVCAVVNVALNLWAIPRHGIMGAAAVTVLTEAVNAVLLVASVMRSGLVALPRLPVLRIGVACSVLAAVAAALSQLPVEAAASAAVLSYLAVLVATGVLRGGELAELRGLARRE